MNETEHAAGEIDLLRLHSSGSKRRIGFWVRKKKEGMDFEFTDLG
jgi:hypothetical protein